MLPYGSRKNNQKTVLSQAVLSVYFLDRGEYVLNVIVHLPSAEKQKEFQKELAEFHSAAVISKLNALHIPQNEKKKILKELKDFI